MHSSAISLSGRSPALTCLGARPLDELTLMTLPLTPSYDSQILAISAIVLLPEEELSDVVTGRPSGTTGCACGTMIGTCGLCW